MPNFAKGSNRVIVRDQYGSVVEVVELKYLDPNEVGGPHRDVNGYILWSQGWLDVPVSIPVDGDYRIEVVAFQEAAGEEPAMLEVVVESDIETLRGARAIRRKLAELHQKLLGVTVTVDSPEVEAAFRLFVEVWDRKRHPKDDAPDWRDEDIECSLRDQRYFEGIADDVLQVYSNDDGDTWTAFNWDRVIELLDEADFFSRDPVVSTWVVVLAYFLTDYRYLYL